MAEIPNFDQLWSRFASGQVGSTLKKNPMMEELCKVIFAAAVTGVAQTGAMVPRDLMPVYMLKLAASAAEAGIRSVDQLLEMLDKQGDGDVTVDLHGVFVPGGFKV
jgi:hypothetical protein